MTTMTTTTQTRREFMRTFGGAVAALLGAGWLQGCMPVATCYAPLPPPSVTPKSLLRRHAAWGRVRQDWLDLPQSTPGQLTGREDGHGAALDQLLVAGEIDAAVAEELLRAYAGALDYYRAQRYMEPTCYEPTAVPPNCYVAPTAPPPTTCYEAPAVAQGRAALAQQLLALQEMAASGALDPATVAKARAAIEQDLALFELVAALEGRPIAEHRAEEDRLAAQHDAGTLAAPPEAVEAARILVELLTNSGEAP